jgi:hypothetical protein
MKNIVRPSLAAFFVFMAFFSGAQCVINSTNGYQVNAKIVPKTVQVSTNDCQWGYNYNLTYDYDVSFSGPNIPSSLYTLQTIIYCNGGQANGGYTMPLTGGVGTSTTTTNPWISNNGTPYQFAPRPSCGQATVQTLSCNSIVLIIHGPGISYQTVACNFTGTVMPVELIDYTGEQTDNGVQLNWSTASETRNDHFTVYRSADAQSWTEMKQIAGAGTKEGYSAYSWTDDAPLTGTNYYRLTQTDVDGNVRDQGIAAIEYIRNDEAATSIYPNPSTTGSFNVRVISRTKSPVEVVLRDQLGRIAGQATLSETDELGNRFILQDVVSTESGNGFYIAEIIQDNILLGRHKVEVQAQH